MKRSNPTVRRLNGNRPGFLTAAVCLLEGRLLSISGKFRATIINRRRLLVFATLAAGLAVPVGCGVGNSTGSNNSGGGGPTGPADFTMTVVIGDSLSAGFQNYSLLDSQQPNGWASLVGTQAGFSLTLPLIAPPCAPSVLELVSLGPPPIIQQASGVTTGRDDRSVQPTDLAVPGHLLNDLINTTPTNVPTTQEELITNMVLGYPVGNDKSQMNEAIQLNPTVIFLWIGNNDALQADDSGTPTSMIPVATFTQQFQQLLNTLHAQTKATLIVANIPDVTTIPYLTPATTILAQAAAETGLTQAQIASALGIQAGDLINATGQSQVQSAVTAIQQGNVPTPLTDAGFLTPQKSLRSNPRSASITPASRNRSPPPGGWSWIFTRSFKIW